MSVKVLLCLVVVQAVHSATVNSRSFPSGDVRVNGSGQGDRAPFHAAFQGRPHQGSQNTGRISKDQSYTLHAQSRNLRGHLTICNLCPKAEDIYPCMCSCVNSTTAELSCGPDLASCAELTQILSAVIFPVTNYFRLVVDGTRLNCMIEEDLWGILTFQEIILMNNQFKTIDNHAFLPFNNTLKLLNMGQNKLANVYFPTLSDQPYLEQVFLQNNSLDFIPGYTSVVLEHLRIFVASINMIYEIEPYTFNGLPSLEMLDLSHNRIGKLSENSLTIHHHSASALSVDLSHNAISYIEPGVIAGVKVYAFNLQYNQLITLQETVFRPLIDLSRGTSRFLVSGNPFTCDDRCCWIATNETVSGCFDNFRCPNLNNEPIDSFVTICSSQTVAVASAVNGGADANVETVNEGGRLGSLLHQQIKRNPKLVPLRATSSRSQRGVVHMNFSTP